MAKDLTQLKKQPDFEWLAEATAATLQQSLKNLESAFKNFFSKRTKFPKLKVSTKNNQSVILKVVQLEIMELSYLN